MGKASDAVTRWGRVDILVNAIGGGAGAALHKAEEYPESDWDWIFDTCGRRFSSRRPPSKR